MPLPLFYRRENRCRGPSPCPRSNKEGTGKPEPTARFHCHTFLPLWKGKLHPQANLSLCLHCVTAITFLSCFLTIPPPGIKKQKTKTPSTCIPHALRPVYRALWVRLGKEDLHLSKKEKEHTYQT